MPNDIAQSEASKPTLQKSATAPNGRASAFAFAASRIMMFATTVFMAESPLVTGDKMPAVRFRIISWGREMVSWEPAERGGMAL
jgi:hypothetical protein